MSSSETKQAGISLAGIDLIIHTGLDQQNGRTASSYNADDRLTLTISYACN